MSEKARRAEALLDRYDYLHGCPNDRCTGYGECNHCTSLADALRQARNEALEEAAGGCALNAKECRVLSRKAEGETRLILRERASAYEACAYMIRALKEDHDG